MSLVKANTQVIGVSTDMLFPVVEQKEIARLIEGSSFDEIDSFYGHDGFLIETKTITEILKRFYQKHKVTL